MTARQRLPNARPLDPQEHDMNPQNPSRQRRALLARMGALCAALCLPASMAMAQGKPSYKGITKVEAFTHVGVAISQPKNPSFELLVYQLDALRAFGATMDGLVPKGLIKAEQNAWGEKYLADHPDFEAKWTAAISKSLDGLPLFQRYKTRGRLPAIVINETWVLTGEFDVDKAIAMYQKQGRN
jgi:hypothetical protein